MPNKEQNFLRQPQVKLIAVLADAILFLCIVRSMADVDGGPEFYILIAALGVIALNATLILRAEKIERQLYDALRTIAIVGNIGVIAIGVLFWAFGLILLHEPNAGLVLELALYPVAVTAALVLNMALIVVAQ